MARVQQGFIDQVLDRVDIVDVIDRRIKLKKTGKNYSACCPFHQEKTPSFSVNPEKQFYYCFGCGAGGNAIGFVMEYERLDFREALSSLAQTLGLEIPADIKNETVHSETLKTLVAAMEHAAKFYEKNLRSHSQRNAVIAYLKKRGVSGEMARDFRIGFAPEGWHSLLNTISSVQVQESAIEAGLLVKNDINRVYDRFRNRVIFPICNERGQVIAMGGRVLGDEKPKYLNSPETPLFSKSRELYGLHIIRQKRARIARILVVEGYLDVIALAQSGIHYSVATLGTSLSSFHLERLFRYTDEILVCFDGDEAGKKAAFRGLEAALPLLEDGKIIRFLILPEGEDPDTLVRKKGRTFLEQLFDQAVPLEKFLFETLSADLDLNSLATRARLANRALPFISKVPDGVFKQLLFKSLASRTGVEEESLVQLSQASKHKTSRPVTTTATNDEKLLDNGSNITSTNTLSKSFKKEAIAAVKSSVINSTTRLLGMLTLRPELANREEMLHLLQIKLPYTNLLQYIVTTVAANKSTTTATILGYWSGTPEGKLLSEAAAKEVIDGEEDFNAEFKTLVEWLSQSNELTRLTIRLTELKALAYSDLSNEQRQELVHLTQRVRGLKGR